MIGELMEAKYRREVMVKEHAFESIRFIGWSLYPMIVLVLLGAMLIFLAIHNPARETMKRKFFV